MGRRSYGIQYRDFSTFLFLPLVSAKGATYLFLTNPLWRQQPAHGAATTAPTRDFYWDVEHPGWPGLWADTGHPGGGAWRL